MLSRHSDMMEVIMATTGSMFSNYDSAAFSEIDESIAHAATNPFIFVNYMDRLRISLGATNKMLITQPESAIKMFLSNLSEFVRTDPLPVYEHYRPEATALRIYGTHDLWFLIMLISNIPSVLEYRRPTFSYLIPESVYQIEKFLREEVNVRDYSPLDTIHS